MIDATETHYLQCEGFEARAKGSGVAYYMVKAIGKEGETSVRFLLTPKELASSKSFKVALLQRGILYGCSNSEHAENLRKMMRNGLTR